MEPALHELSKTLGALSGSIDSMVDDNKASERRRNRRSWWTLGFACLLAIAVGVLTVLAIYTIHASHINRRILDRIESVTGPAGQERSAAATRAILASNAVETDCRSRRQQARLPAPDAPPAPPANLHGADLAAYFARYSCQAQTDPSIYPGVAGQPAKGA